MQKLASGPKGRDLSIDTLKIIAIFCVVTIHVAAGGFSAPLWSSDWYSTLFWGTLVRSAVPVFLMCSGALFLDPDKDFSVKRLYTKNLPRIVVAMVFWAAAYKLYHLIIGHTLNITGIVRAVKDIVLFRQEFHLYYLQIILLFYVLVPVIRVLSTRGSRREMQYALLIWLVLGILYQTFAPFFPLNKLSGVPAQWMISKIYTVIGYGLSGFYLKKYARKSPVLYALLFFAGFAFVFAGTCWVTYQRGALYTGFLEGVTLGVALMAIGLFGFVKDLCGIRHASEKLILKTSNSTFCIYLTHVFFLYILKANGILLFSPYLVSIPILVILTLIPSFAVFLVLSRIPVVNKYLV